MRGGGRALSDGLSCCDTHAHWVPCWSELVPHIDRNWELLAPFAGTPVTVPALYIMGDRDLVLSFRGMDQVISSLSKFVPRLQETIILPGCGHWTQQERAAEVNVAMIDFLRRH
jgi:pimeloyl-ACP methyl ester carboxylesterase